jgi:hypothetical protein
MYKLHTWTHGDTLIVKLSQKFPSVFGRYLESMNITLRKKNRCYTSYSLRGGGKSWLLLVGIRSLPVSRSRCTK